MKTFSELEIQGRGATSQVARDRLVAELRQKGIEDERVLRAIAATPRHLFLDSALASRAYEDIALPIGWEQTISQPLVVAIMAQALIEDRPGDKPLSRVLEVGTGSGYNAAVLAQLSRQILSLERIAGLHQIAAERLAALGLHQIELRLEDASGSRLTGRFDAISCTAACREPAPQWLEALAIDGRLVAPVGEGRSQSLVLIERTGAEQLKRTNLGPVAFVPLLEGVRQ